jgi:hypothetical protein
MLGLREGVQVAELDLAPILRLEVKVVPGVRTPAATHAVQNPGTRKTTTPPRQKHAAENPSV